MSYTKNLNNQAISPILRQQIISEVLAARDHRDQFLALMSERQQQGWQIARQSAQILKEKYHVKRVVLFGSLLDYQQMTWRSDIDLAVWGLSLQDFWAAGAEIERGHDFTVDLVEGEFAKPHILVAITRGIDL